MRSRGLGFRALGAWGDPLGPAAARRTGTALFCLLVAVVAFHDLGARGVHTLDLPRFGVLAREMLRTGEWLVPQRYGEVYANKPPLHVWLVAIPAAVVGDVTPLLVRWPSALGLVLLAVSTSAWGRLRAGSVGAGRAAALLLLGTYAVTRFGREGRPDMLASGLAVAAAYLLDRLALGRGRSRHVILAGLLLGLALLAKGPALLVLPGLVAAVPGDAGGVRTRLANARLGRVLALAVAVAGLWFVPAVIHGGWAYGEALLLEQAADRVAGTATHVEPWYHYVVRMVDAGAPWTPLYLLALALALVPARAGIDAARGPVRAGVATLVLFSCVPTKHVRYVVGVFAPLALGGGALLARFVARPAAAGWGALARLGRGAALGAGVLLPWAPGVPPSARLPLAVPAALLVALGVGLLGPRGESPRAARRRLVGSVLVAVVLLLHAYWIVRDRYRIRPREAFDRAVAEVVTPGVPVWTLDPLEPGHVFQGAPGARLARRLADLPPPAESPRLLVLAPEARRGDVERRRGQAGRVLLSRRMGDRWPQVVLLAFDAR